MKLEEQLWKPLEIQRSLNGFGMAALEVEGGEFS